jgi:hypothetical protein
MLQTTESTQAPNRRVSLTRSGALKGATAIWQAVEYAGSWMLHSGIQHSDGGVARYYDAAKGENRLTSTEITGYAVNVFLFLYSVTNNAAYIERAMRAGRFLMCRAWDRTLGIFPYEHGRNGSEPHHLAYFFDTGIITRALIALARATRQQEYLDFAIRCGNSLARDFASADGTFSPILKLPSKDPSAAENRWSRSVGC